MQQEMVENNLVLVPMYVKIDQEVKDKIARQAKLNRRTLAHQVEIILKASVDGE